MNPVWSADMGNLDPLHRVFCGDPGEKLRTRGIVLLPASRQPIPVCGVVPSIHTFHIELAFLSLPEYLVLS